MPDITESSAYKYITTWVLYYNFVPEALHCPGIQVLHCFPGDPDKQTNLRTEILVDTQMKVMCVSCDFCC